MRVIMGVLAVLTVTACNNGPVVFDVHGNQVERPEAALELPTSDVEIFAPPCGGVRDYAPVLQEIVDYAQHVQDNVSPRSDAAVHSTTGAVVVVRLPPGTCRVVNLPVRVTGPGPITLRGAPTILKAAGPGPTTVLKAVGPEPITQSGTDFFKTRAGKN